MGEAMLRQAQATIAVFGVLIGAIVCAAPSRAETGVYSGEYDGELREAERLGRLIYEKDQAAWHASDVVVADPEIRADTRIAGWITEPLKGDNWRVLFYGTSPDGYAPLYSVDVKNRKASRKITRYPAGAEFSEVQSAMVRARLRALGEPFELCSRSYNTVLLPADEEGEFYVYLLASTTQSGAVVIGGHYRMRISADGKDVIEKKQFTGGCMVFHIGDVPLGAQLFMSNNLALFPGETYVFLSTQHKLPIYVVTTKNGITWSVDGDKIEAMKPEKN